MGKHARAFQLLMVENANILQLQLAEISSIVVLLRPGLKSFVAPAWRIQSDS